MRTFIPPPIRPIIVFVLLTLLHFAALRNAGAAVVTCADNLFVPGTWTASVLGGSAQSGTTVGLSTQVGGAGQLGNALTATISSVSNPFTFDVGVFSPCRWNTSTDGVMSSISFSMYHQSLNDDYYGEIRFALRQGGRVYVAAGAPYIVQSYSSSWRQINRTVTVSPTAFSPAFGAAAPLDFSAAGGPISFGFVDSRPDFGPGNPRYWRTALWSTTVTTADVPAPGALFLALLGLGSGGTSRRRRR